MNVRKIQRRVKKEAKRRQRNARYKATKILLKDLPYDIENLIFKKIYELNYKKCMKQIKKINYNVCDCGCFSSFRRSGKYTIEYYIHNFVKDSYLGFEELWTHKYLNGDVYSDKELVNVLYYSPLSSFNIEYL
jgi:predicted AAA+ superfamily ATPase